MIQTLAMSDIAQMALVAILGAFVTAITAPIVGILLSISRKIDRVEKQTNGNLSEQRAKADLAESRVPGITTVNGPRESRTLIINDPTSPTPPIITSLPKDFP